MTNDSSRNKTWQPRLKNASVVSEFYHRVLEDPHAIAVRFLDRDLGEQTWTREQVWSSAGVVAARLEAAGVQPGEVCALLLPYRADIGAWYWGIARLGAIPALLAYPSARLHPEKFRAGMEGVAKHSGLDIILTDADLRPKAEPLIKGGTVRKILTVDQIEVAAPARAGRKGAHESIRPLARAATDDAGVELNRSDECAGSNESADTVWDSSRFHEAKEDDLFLLQHSSGTTGLQKAVALSNGAILKQLAALSESLQLVADEDVIVSWLPLYHDMGLIAAWLLPFLSGTPHVQLSALDWVGQPDLFLTAMSKFRGTIGWLPNFAFNLMAGRVSSENARDLDLSPVRRLVNCSEPVRDASHEAFLERFKANGLQSNALAASYALAENVFAVTQTPVHEAPKTLYVQQETLQNSGKIVLGEKPTPNNSTSQTEASHSGAAHKAKESKRPVRACVSSGRPVRDSKIAILDENNIRLQEGHVGEVVIQSPYLFDGYRRNLGIVRPISEEGWFATGDLGFILDEELYVVGRKKDLLIVRGKNLYPEDIEDCAGSEPGVRAGRVCAWGEYVKSMGTEAVMVLAETALEDPKERKDLARKVRQRVQRELDIFVQRVHLVAPRWLVKSSSGKMARHTNVERWKTERAVATSSV